MINKIKKYGMPWFEKKWRVTYRERLHWRIGSTLTMARIELEVALDHPGSNNDLVSEVLNRLNRIERLSKSGRIAL